MVTDYVTPMDKTYDLLGQPTVSLQPGVDESVAWLRAQPEYISIPRRHLDMSKCSQAKQHEKLKHARRRSTG